MAKIKYTSTGLPSVNDGSGNFRALAALAPSRDFKLPVFESKFPSLPESEWQPSNLKNWNIPIFDQGQYGSCVGQATVTAFTYSYAISGQDIQIFSPTYIYSLINGNRDGGAQVSQGLEAIKDKGTCLMSQFGQDKIYRKYHTKEIVETAKRFKALEGYKINTWIELGSALTIGMPCVFGIAVGNNFSKLDRSGIAPLPDRIAGGHALCAISLQQINKKWVLHTQNSWSRGWGMDGFCYITKEHFNPRYGFGFDVFAISGVIDDPGVVINDPPVFKKENKDGYVQSTSIEVESN